VLENVKKYIKEIRNRIKDLVPSEELEPIMSEVSEIVLKNWVDEGEYKLTMSQIMSLVRRHIAKKYSSN